MVSEFQNIFSSFQNGILSLDPVYWVEKHLTIDGRDFDLSSGAWKPFADIYRYVGLKSTEPNALPVVVLKSRQTGGTVMANAIELYMMGCNMYGNTKPPMRIIHAFPTLEMAKTYSKTKFSQMVGSAKILNHTQKKSDVKNCIQEMVDSDFNSSVHFKPFIGGNHIWIDSTGITGDRLRGRTVDAIFYDEVQDITSTAISNSNQMLKQSMYGPETKGIQVYFGTPKSKGSTFYKLWNSSNQQYYHLGCHECKNTFPLYTPESDEWEKVWIRDFIVKCPHCGCEQDKREAAGRGKWISTKDSNECQYIGFHINQMYMPKVKKEMFMSEKPGIHPINTERAFKNEVLGEFYDGDASPLTMEEIIQNCGLPEVKFVSNIPPGETLVLLGIDYGARSGLELLANPESKTNTGQSYTTAVVLFEKGPGLLQIAYATIFKRTDAASKKSLISQIMKRYSVNVAVGDIGYSNDFSNDMHIEYGDRYIVSRAGGRMIDHVKFNKDFFPKEISFDRDFYIGEIIEQIKKGQIKFPLGSYSINGIEGVDWLIQHCCNLELKPIISRNSDPTPHYVKAGENDGFMALLNAYIGYKFLITDGFSTKNPALLKDGGKKKGILATSGYVGRRL